MSPPLLGFGLLLCVVMLNTGLVAPSDEESLTQTQVMLCHLAAKLCPIDEYRCLQLIAGQKTDGSCFVSWTGAVCPSMFTTAKTLSGLISNAQSCPAASLDARRKHTTRSFRTQLLERIWNPVSHSAHWLRRASHTRQMFSEGKRGKGDNI